MPKVDKSSKKSLALEEVKISARDIREDFQSQKSNKKLKGSSIKRFKPSKRSKRKRANQISKLEQMKKYDELNLLESNTFDISEHDSVINQNVDFQSIKAGEQMRRVNVKHNLSKVEEEEWDDTIHESKIHSTLLTKNILSKEYKFGSAQIEDKYLNKTSIFKGQGDEMEIFFEGDETEENPKSFRK